jgi:RNA polymerase sigma-70 factor (ECF subfamily)
MMNIIEGIDARPSSAPEDESIQKAQKGDLKAFEQLYTRHKARVFSLCLRMTNNYAHAEELTQETFLQLYRKIASFRGESAFSTWLYRMSVNVVLTRFRRKRLLEVPLEEVVEGTPAEERPKELGQRDRVLDGSLHRVDLEQAIRRLPPGYRLIFLLHDVEGYEHQEIADMLNCSIGNSKSQLHNARMRLRTLLVQSRGGRGQGNTREIDEVGALPSAAA